jgi:hypothetical protein
MQHRRWKKVKETLLDILNNDNGKMEKKMDNSSND